MEKSWVGTHAVPLRRHCQMHQARITAVDRPFQVLESGIHVADFGVIDRQLHRRERLRLARSALDKQSGQTRPSAGCVSFANGFEDTCGNSVRLGVGNTLLQPLVEIPFLQVSARQEFPGVRMSGV